LSLVAGVVAGVTSGTGISYQRAIALAPVSEMRGACMLYFCKTSLGRAVTTYSLVNQPYAGLSQSTYSEEGDFSNLLKA